MLPASMDGKMKVLAWPATGEPLHLVAATTGDTAASNCSSPSIASSGFISFAYSVASRDRATVPPLPEPLVEKDRTATFGSMPKALAVFAVSIATSASFWLPFRVTLPSLSTESG